MDVNAIYIAGHEDEKTVKIGRTGSSVQARLRSHQGRGPGRTDVRMIFGVIGLPSDETAIHNRFAEFRLDEEREWFRAEEPVLRWIRWARAQWFAYRDAEQMDADRSNWAERRVESDQWLPGSEQQIPEDEGLPLGDSWSDISLNEPDVTGDDYYTDRRIVDAARTTMGGIDLDPATHPTANDRYIRAPRYFTYNTNGLQQDWSGRVWLNPPFSQWHHWCPKILHELASGRVEAMCVLMPTRSLTTQANHPLLSASNALCITRGRIPFWGPKASSPDDGHAIFYFGPHVTRFREAFAPIGATFLGEGTPTAPRRAA